MYDKQFIRANTIWLQQNKKGEYMHPVKCKAIVPINIALAEEAVEPSGPETGQRNQAAAVGAGIQGTSA